jgi:3-hydroxybutyryl-CoA dehydrogenase
MGAGIAQVAAMAGHPVRLLDNRPQAAQNAVEGIRAQLERLVVKGKMAAHAARAASQRLQAATEQAELQDAALVIEAIVEDLHAKQTLFTGLENWVSPDCLFGSNTSSISITAIGAALRHPERLAGLHFFNPAPLMALVEVVSGLATARTVADTLHATASAWGKTAVHAQSTPGFIVNRVARPFYAEALRLHAEGAADCATLDAVMRDAGGFRMGPFELMDMIGHDVNFAVTCSVWRAFFNDPRFLPSLTQQALVDAGFLGRKTGRGFYHYAPTGKPAALGLAAQTPPNSNTNSSTTQPTTKTTQTTQIPQVEPHYPAPQHTMVCGDSPLAQALATRLQAANIHFERSAAHPDGRIAQTDAALIYQSDGRSASQRAAESGHANTVLVDLALDYQRCTRIAATHAGQCSPAAWQAACALLQHAGMQVARLGDVPGLLVLRSVAMLANEAADAVYHGVCTALAADDAMCLGVNYPLGPLAWADRLGLPWVQTVLRHLAAFYGEDRYRTSALISQRVFQGKNIHA